jgi:hypothetical protein
MGCDSGLGWNPSKQLDSPDDYDYDYGDYDYDYDDDDDDEHCEENPDGLPNNVVNWSKAGHHIGESITIYGEVKDVYYKQEMHFKDHQEFRFAESPTFITIGADYPSNRRIKVVIWGQNRKNFSPSPETLYSEKTICVTGKPYLYNDIVSMEVTNPSQIQVFDNANSPQSNQITPMNEEGISLFNLD